MVFPKLSLKNHGEGNFVMSKLFEVKSGFESALSIALPSPHSALLSGLLLGGKQSLGALWLERRPASGIWGGLYCLPVFETEDALLFFLPERSRLHIQRLPPFKHVLTHKDMHLSPLIARFSANQKMPSTDTSAQGHWFLPEQSLQLGLPAPIRKLLENESAR